MPKLRLGTGAKRFRGLRGLVVLSLVGVVTVTGCAAGASGNAGHASPTPPGADERPLVLTTFTVIADMTREIAGDDVRVESITRVGAEIHGYEPTPGDLKRVAGADLVLDNGLGLEAWFEQFLTHTDAPRVTLSDGIEGVDIAREGQRDGVAQPNPHAWMSPIQARTYVDNIVTALSELEPASASAFRDRGDAYREELDDIAGTLEAAVASVPEQQRVLVTCEGAFSYLARDAGLDEAYLWPVNADQDPTARDIAAVIDLVREQDVPAVFCESTVSDRAMRQVEDATDAIWGGTLYVDSLSQPDGPVPTYLDLLRHDVDVIVAGLTGATS